MTQACRARFSVRRVGPEAAPPGAFLVEVAVTDGPSVLYTVANWSAGVQVIDPNGEDLTVGQGLDYLTHRVTGASPREALKLTRKAGRL